MTLTLLHSKMFDVGDLPVLTFGNCVLKTDVIKWLLKLYVRLLRFWRFLNPKNITFYVFWVVAHVFSNADYADDAWTYPDKGYGRSGTVA